jgi:hypothetical protein
LKILTTLPPPPPSWTYSPVPNGVPYASVITGLRYDPGGYVVDIRTAPEEFNATVAHLRGGWIDERTRAVFVNVNVYNANVNVWMSVQFVRGGVFLVC